jgi:hypothetical protein
MTDQTRSEQQDDLSEIATQLASALRLLVHPPDLWELDWHAPRELSGDPQDDDLPPVLMLTLERPTLPDGKLFKLRQMVPYQMVSDAAIGPLGVAGLLIENWYRALRAHAIPIE